MGVQRRAVRLFFNTYYEEDAERALEALKRAAGGREIRVYRSMVVPELYYVEIPLDERVSDEEAARLAEAVAEAVRSVSDTVFGVKAYYVGGSGG